MESIKIRNLNIIFVRYSNTYPKYNSKVFLARVIITFRTMARIFFKGVEKSSFFKKKKNLIGTNYL